jgi:probable non-F420 flavinoid oxidoreductase
MTLYSYHVSQEQFPPRALLGWVQRAERAGFDGAFSSDHLQPWSPSQGESAFTWSWLGAAMQATTRLRFGTVTVPGGWRYQPVVLAQAIATLAAMFPGRLPWVALGSGEAVNEAVAGPEWPPKAERNQRLFNAAMAIKALLAGERVTTEGPPALRDARLWCRPATPPLLVGAATSASTAEWLGGWADGLLTVGRDVEALRSTIAAFRRGGGSGKPVFLKVDLSWAPSEAEARRQAHDNWRFNVAPGDANTELLQPEDFDAATRHLTAEAMQSHVFISSDPQAHVAHLQACAALGVESIDLHQVGSDQEGFIDVFGGQVLPALRRRA